jgi:hypothetical protein
MYKSMIICLGYVWIDDEFDRIIYATVILIKVTFLSFYKIMVTL